MWNQIMERMPTTLGWIFTVLAFLIPYGTYKINQKLHKSGDPPWKKEEYDNQYNEGENQETNKQQPSN
ncbi:hypothetical protein [Oceanobacillus salinisoli]|uniref:hypothetical protein n=1 Tax=Oceanobacillus salinisoli TaxID=2678611 RepID=UPI0018CC0DB1